MGMSNNILSLQSVSKYFTTSDELFSSGRQFAALDNVSLDIKEGASLGIVGESGSGKTTIARLICSIYKADSGNIFYKDKNILSLNNDEKREYRKNVQMVFQDPNNTLNPKLTIKSSLIDGIKKYITSDKNKINEHLEKLMEMVGLPFE